MKAKTIKGKTPKELGITLEASLNDGFKPSIAFVFVPARKDIESVSDLFDQKGISIIGASSFGQFIDEDFDTETIVVMLLDIKPENFRLEYRQTGNNTTREIARSIAESGKTAFSKPAFLVVSGGIKTDGEMIVNGIQDAAGKDVTLYGGMAASNFQVMETFIFTNNKITDNGILALILDESKVSVSGLAIGGSEPIGIPHTITRSSGNIVYTIDDQPALDMVLRYCGKGSDGVKEQIDMLNIASYFQVQLARENASPIMRTPMFANMEDRSIVFAGSLPQDSKIKFSILPGFEVVDNLVSEYREFNKKNIRADAMIMFSCAGRQIAFGPYMPEEIRRVGEIWNAPMVGFFTFGEMGCGPDGKYEFYNMTCSLALLSEN